VSVYVQKFLAMARYNKFDTHPLSFIKQSMFETQSVPAIGCNRGKVSTQLGPLERGSLSQNINDDHVLVTEWSSN
jgi:hypothetical protein